MPPCLGAPFGKEQNIQLYKIIYTIQSVPFIEVQKPQFGLLVGVNCQIAVGLPLGC